MKKSMKANSISMKIASLVLAIVLAIGTFSIIPSLDVRADTMPIGSVPDISLNKIITLTNTDSYHFGHAWGQHHYYTLTIPETGILTIHDIKNTYSLEIRDANDKEVHNLDGYFTEVKTNSLYLRGGKYSISIGISGDKGAEGKFSLSFTSLNETYKESETSNNDSESTPSKISSLSGAVNKGVLSQNDIDDWYSFNVTNNSIISFNLKSLTSKGINYTIIKNDGAPFIDQARWNENEFKNTFVISQGSYLLKITGDKDQNYNFSIKATALNTSANSLIGKAPVVKAKKKGKLTVKWNKYAMAGGYQIQVSKKKNFAGATTKNVEATSNNLNMTVKKAWRGKKVFVRVRAYVITPDEQKIYTNWSKVKTVKTKKK